LRRKDISVCILRVGGTNCDAETRRAFRELGVCAEVVNMNELVRQRSVLSYDVLVFPGGFSYGDYVRAGAIWAKWLLAKMGRELRSFVSEGRPVLGICNGFQVLVEAGLLPAFDGISIHPEAALAVNVPPGYDCRWVNIRYEGLGNCLFTRYIPRGKVLRMPIAHGEGRFLFSADNEEKFLKKLIENDQLVFRYCRENGDPAEGVFPANPNGSFYDVVGVCNPSGTVFGLMPHPERAFYGWQQPDWTGQRRLLKYGDGKLIFESLVSYLEKSC
jgi:phosphoribosylformylglycinamidine synthase I